MDILAHHFKVIIQVIKFSSHFQVKICISKHKTLFHNASNPNYLFNLFTFVIFNRLYFILKYYVNTVVYFLEYS